LFYGYFYLNKCLVEFVLNESNYSMFVTKTARVDDNDDNFINGIEGLSKPLFGVLPEIIIYWAVI
jgi:hypothetical protein